MNPASDEIRFELDAFTPQTLPMGRMAEYLKALAEMLGSEANVHFRNLESGSSVFRLYSDLSAIPKVRERLAAIVDSSAPRSALKAQKQIDDLLAEDNSVGAISIGTAKIIQFPGRLRPKVELIGPVRRGSVLDGQIFQIGGKDETVNIYLRNGDRELRCEVSIPLARKLAAHLLAEPVRIFGEADWYRTDVGWTMKGFYGSDFTLLDQRTFEESLARVRDLTRDIPVDERLMQELRHG